MLKGKVKVEFIHQCVLWAGRGGPRHILVRRKVDGRAAFQNPSEFGFMNTTHAHMRRKDLQTTRELGCDS